MTAGEKEGVTNGETGAIGNLDNPGSSGACRCIELTAGHY